MRGVTFTPVMTAYSTQLIHHGWYITRIITGVLCIILRCLLYFCYDTTNNTMRMERYVYYVQCVGNKSFPVCYPLNSYVAYPVNTGMVHVMYAPIPSTESIMQAYCVSSTICYITPV